MSKNYQKMSTVKVDHQTVLLNEIKLRQSNMIFAIEYFH